MRKFEDMKSEDEWPKRLTLVGRSRLTFESYVNGVLKDTFYTPDFIRGICNQRKLIRKEFSNAYGYCFLLTSILAFFHILPDRIKLSIVQIDFSSDLIPIITLIASFSFF